MSEVISQLAPPLPKPLPVSKAQCEYQAFIRLLPQLLTTHRGLYVAIHNEQVIDSSPDEVELVLRVWERIGRVPIHVERVAESNIVRMPSFRVLSDGADR